MPRSVGERVAEHRRRQRAAGMISVSVVVPRTEARFFRELARTARAKHRPRRVQPSVDREATRPALSNRQLKIARRWATETGLSSEGMKPGLTLAEVLSRSIAHDIVRQGWPLGRNLGSLQDLQSRFAVGRNLIREAIRKLESQSIVVVRRGKNAGVVVTEPSLEAAAFSVASIWSSTRSEVRTCERPVAACSCWRWSTAWIGSTAVVAPLCVPHWRQSMSSTAERERTTTNSWTCSSPVSPVIQHSNCSWT